MFQKFPTRPETKKHDRVGAGDTARRGVRPGRPRSVRSTAPAAAGSRSRSSGPCCPVTAVGCREAGR